MFPVGHPFLPCRPGNRRTGFPVLRLRPSDGTRISQVIFAQPLQVRGVGFYVNCFFHVSPFRSAARKRLLLIVAVCRRFAEEQSREGELQGGGVAIDHLPGDVQEDAVALLVRVIQRSVRHEEEVLRSQPEGVRRGGGDGGADLLKLDGRNGCAIVPVAHAINMKDMAVHHNTPFAIITAMSYRHGEQGR